MRAHVLLAALLASGFAAPVAAQAPPAAVVSADSSALLQIELTDGSTLFGRILEDGDSVTIELVSGGRIRLARDAIRATRVVRGQVVRGAVWAQDPNATRLFFAPTGRSLPAGGGYISVYELFVPFLAVGVTDWLTLAGGMPLIFGEGGPGIFWLAPKLRVLNASKVQAAVGTLSFFGDGGHVGVVYGVVTAGSSTDHAVTAAVGYGYWDGVGFGDEPVFMLGGETRISSRVKLISENYMFPGEGLIVSAGPRFFGDRLTADLGLATPLFAGGELFVFPLVNFVYNW